MKNRAICLVSLGCVALSLLGWLLASPVSRADIRSLTVDESCISDYGIGTSKQIHRILVEKEASGISDNAGLGSDPSKRQSGQAVYFSRADILKRDLIQLCIGGVAIAFALLFPFVIRALLAQGTIPRSRVLDSVILALAMFAISNAGQIVLLACNQPSTSELFWSPNDTDQPAAAHAQPDAEPVRGSVASDDSIFDSSTRRR